MELLLLELLSLKAALDGLEVGEISPSKLLLGVEGYNSSLLFLGFLLGLLDLLRCLFWLFGWFLDFLLWF
jgi:hypothetical protein